MLPTVAGLAGMYHHAQLFSFEIVSHEIFFCLYWPGTQPPVYLGMTSVPHFIHLLVVMGWGAGLMSCSGWPQTTILLIAVPEEAKITGVSHQCPTQLALFCLQH
jgi:hypothetical protein